jgi:hypothetical protein
LKEYDMDVETVGRDLKAVMNVTAPSLDILASQKIVSVMIENILDGVVGN